MFRGLKIASTKAFFKSARDAICDAISGHALQSRHRRVTLLRLHKHWKPIVKMGVAKVSVTQVKQNVKQKPRSRHSLHPPYRVKHVKRWQEVQFRRTLRWFLKLIKTPPTSPLRPTHIDSPYENFRLVSEAFNPAQCSQKIKQGLRDTPENRCAQRGLQSVKQETANSIKTAFEAALKRKRCKSRCNSTNKTNAKIFKPSAFIQITPPTTNKHIGFPSRCTQNSNH